MANAFSTKRITNGLSEEDGIFVVDGGEILNLTFHTVASPGRSPSPSRSQWKRSSEAARAIRGPAGPKAV